MKNLTWILLKFYCTKVHRKSCLLSSICKYLYKFKFTREKKQVSMDPKRCEMVVDRAISVCLPVCKYFLLFTKLSFFFSFFYSVITLSLLCRICQRSLPNIQQRLCEIYLCFPEGFNRSVKVC